MQHGGQVASTNTNSKDGNILSDEPVGVVGVAVVVFPATGRVPVMDEAFT